MGGIEKEYTLTVCQFGAKHRGISSRNKMRQTGSFFQGNSHSMEEKQDLQTILHYCFRQNTVCRQQSREGAAENTVHFDGHKVEGAGEQAVLTAGSQGAAPTWGLQKTSQSR